MCGGGGGPIPIYSNYLNIYRFKQFEFFKREQTATVIIILVVLKLVYIILFT